jgi:hypothetical protein
MFSRILVATLVLAMPPLVLTGAPSQAAPSQAAPVLEHDIAVAGGAELAPAFDPAVSRYAVRPGTGPAGELTFTATTTDPQGTVRVDGVPVIGPTTLTGLEPGAEISVLVDDEGGTAAYALVYLPAGFPEIATVVDEPAAGDEELLLTLSKFTVPAPSYEVALDRNNVPAHLRVVDVGQASVDLKPAPGGHYTVMRAIGTSPGGVGNWELVELDERFRPVRSYRSVGLGNTDSHDAILRADGSHLLVAYELDPDTGLLDAVIQDISAAGAVEFQWNSANHFLPGETTAGSNSDYAHINSVDETADGDLLVSFRHTSSVMRIARTAHDGHAEGDVIWRLGGRFSDFDFPDDSAATGPCAQHTATEVAGGHVLVYDNGSGPLDPNPSYCVNQDDPTGPAANRYQTRVTEYALDEVAGTATTAWSYEVPGRFAYFAGSAYRVPDGRTVIGWASAQDALATEVAADGTPLWESATDDGYFTYRAHLHDVPDRIAPEVEVAIPADGAVYALGQAVTASFGCSDGGGSTLRSCTIPGALDTSTYGTHTYPVTATDGDGNTTTVTRTYTVPAPVVPTPAPVSVHRPDLAVRGSGTWTGIDRYDDEQQARLVLPPPGATRTARLRISNRGTDPEQLVLRSGPVGDRFAVGYRYDGRRVPVGRGGWTTPVLAPGARLTVLVRVRGPEAHRRADLALTARSGDGTTDRVVLRLRG